MNILPISINSDGRYFSIWLKVLRTPDLHANRCFLNITVPGPSESLLTLRPALSWKNVPLDVGAWRRGFVFIQLQEH